MRSVSVDLPNWALDALEQEMSDTGDSRGKIIGELIERHILFQQRVVPKLRRVK
jgi:hypothetical protein